MSQSMNLEPEMLSDRRQDLLNTLRQVPLFAHLQDDRLQWLAEQGTEIQRSPGAAIVRQGDAADGFYIILEGKLSGREQLAKRKHMR